jgi:hypothetical protein
MNPKSIALVIATALSSLATSAVATPLTLNGSVTNGTLLHAGNVGGQFTMGPLAADQVISGASFTFTFADDVDNFVWGMPQVTSSSYGAYAYDSTYSFTYYQRTFTAYKRTGTRSQTVEKTGEQEAVSLSLGGVAAGSGATSLAESSSQQVYEGFYSDQEVKRGPEGYYYCGNGCSGYGPLNIDNYYSAPIVTQTNQVRDWTGTFTISGTIDDQATLDALLTSGRLAFDLGISGDLYLSSSTLQLDITEKVKPPPGQVPEPATSWLMLGALGVLGCMLRRRARNT